MKPQNPIIKRDPDLGWEVMVPASLLPETLRAVSISPEGLYIEASNEACDLIPFQDLADLVECPGEYIPDDPMDFEITSRSRLITNLLPYVAIAKGQPSDHRDTEPTGQERAYRRWDADQRYEFTYPGGDD